MKTDDLVFDVQLAQLPACMHLCMVHVRLCSLNMFSDWITHTCGWLS